MAVDSCQHFVSAQYLKELEIFAYALILARTRFGLLRINLQKTVMTHDFCQYLKSPQ